MAPCKTITFVICLLSVNVSELITRTDRGSDLSLIGYAYAHPVEDRFIQKIRLPSGQTLLIAEGEYEPRSIGSFSVRVYEKAALPINETAYFIAGLVRYREGSVRQAVLDDIDGTGPPELVVIVGSAGSGAYLFADAFSVSRQGQLALIGSVEWLPPQADPVAALRRQWADKSGDADARGKSD